MSMRSGHPAHRQCAGNDGLRRAACNNPAVVDRLKIGQISVIVNGAHRFDPERSRRNDRSDGSAFERSTNNRNARRCLKDRNQRAIEKLVRRIVLKVGVGCNNDHTHVLAAKYSIPHGRSVPCFKSERKRRNGTGIMDHIRRTGGLGGKSAGWCRGTAGMPDEHHHWHSGRVCWRPDHGSAGVWRDEFWMGCAQFWCGSAWRNCAFSNYRAHAQATAPMTGWVKEPEAGGVSLASVFRPRFLSSAPARTPEEARGIWRNQRK
jgi:hypothetical protein